MSPRKNEIIEILTRSLDPLKPFLADDQIKIKARYANNFNEQGATQVSTGKLLAKEWNFDFFEGLKIQNIYKELLPTEDRFNNYEIIFDKDLKADAKFWWDQEYYDKDVEGNKKLRKTK